MQHGNSGQLRAARSPHPLLPWSLFFSFAVEQAADKSEAKLVSDGQAHITGKSCCLYANCSVVELLVKFLRIASNKCNVKSQLVHVIVEFFRPVACRPNSAFCFF